MRDVAVVASAQTVHHRRVDDRNEVEMLMPVLEEVKGAVGVTPITLVHDATCGVTGKTLPAGSEAFMVLFDDPRRKLITGRDALPHASTSNQENADD